MVKFPSRFSAIFSITLLLVFASPFQCHAFLSLPLMNVVAECEEWLSKSDALSKLPIQIERTDDTFISPLQKIDFAENLIGAASTSLTCFGFTENDQSKWVTGSFFITNFCAYDLQIQLKRYSWGWTTHENEPEIITSQKTHVIPLMELEGSKPYTDIIISIPLENGRKNHICSYSLRTFLGYLTPTHLAFVNGHNDPFVGKIQN